MPSINQMPDDKFQEALEELVLFNNPKNKIYDKTKASADKVSNFEDRIYKEWTEMQDMIDINFRKIKAKRRVDILIAMAYQAFQQSKKAYKEIYKNNVGTDKEYINHKISTASAGDHRWFSILADLCKWEQSANLANVNDESFDYQSIVMLHSQIEELKEMLDVTSEPGDNSSD